MAQLKIWKEWYTRDLRPALTPLACSAWSVCVCFWVCVCRCYPVEKILLKPSCGLMKLLSHRHTSTCPGLNRCEKPKQFFSLCWFKFWISEAQKAAWEEFTVLFFFCTAEMPRCHVALTWSKQPALQPDLGAMTEADERVKKSHCNMKSLKSCLEL